MIGVDYVRLMARYGAWQNAAQIAVLDRVDEAALHADRGLFFGSILATLNHLAWADALWLHRFAQTGLPAVDTIARSKALCPDWPSYKAERHRVDRLIESWGEALDPAWLEGTSTWHSGSTGRTETRPRSLLVIHVFNHQTHHRGQVNAALTGMGLDPGPTDLAFMPGLESSPSPPLRR